jgi:hypothetical protein
MKSALLDETRQPMERPDAKAAAGLAALVLALCAGCGGSSGGAPAASLPFSVSPSSVVIGVPSAPASLTVANASAPVTARADDPLLVSLSVSGSTVNVVPIASGRGTITVASGGSSSSLPLTIDLCTPPNPTFTLASPPNGATGVSASQGAIVLAVQSANAYTPATIASTIVARVVSATGTDVVTAAPLHAAPAPPGAPAGGTYFAFSVPALPPQNTFTVQAYIVSEPCLPPSSIGAGTFST